MCSSGYYYYFLKFWPHYVAVPQPGIEPTSPAVKVWRLNHWTTREVPSGYS